MTHTLQRQRDGQPVALTSQLASSGEGTVWTTSAPGLLAKIYHQPTPERLAKLEAMLADPPSDPMAGRQHVTFAWPTDLLRERGWYGRPAGFLMPHVRDAQQLVCVYSPAKRRQKGLEVHWRYLHVAAGNFARAVGALHAKGYVLGDIKPQNVLINSRALPSIIDTDSFQVRQPRTGRVFRCPVGSEGFTPPELLGRLLDRTDQDEPHDRFRLAVVIYYLLFGYHPFTGQWRGPGDPPPQDELIRRGHWPFASGGPIRPSRTTIPLQALHPRLRDLFLRAFNDGHARPHARPAAAEWADGLQRADEDLAACPRCPTHFFSAAYGRCSWCERRQQLGVDVFEPLAARRGPVPRQVACAICGRQNQVAASNPANAFCASCRGPLGATPGRQPAPSLFAQLGQTAGFVASLGQRLVQMVQGINSALSGGPAPAPPPALPAPPPAAASPSPIRRRRKPAPTRVAAGIVVGNIKSKRYHGPSCGTGAKIGYQRRVQFSDWRDAERAGFKRCGACQGR